MTDQQRWDHTQQFQQPPQGYGYPPPGQGYPPPQQGFPPPAGIPAASAGIPAATGLPGRATRAQAEEAAHRPQRASRDCGRHRLDHHHCGGGQLGEGQHCCQLAGVRRLVAGTTKPGCQDAKPGRSRCPAVHPGAAAGNRGSQAVPSDGGGFSRLGLIQQLTRRPVTASPGPSPGLR